MNIENNVLKHYLRNVYFITGTAYAGKSTTAKLLADRYDMVLCGENYHSAVSDLVADPEIQPDLCYMRQLTNIPTELLREISDYRRVVVMLSPQSMSVERFFDRDDPEKQFLLSVIEGCEEPQRVMENYKAGLKRINSKEHFEEYESSGFYTILREDNGKDTRDAVCDEIAKHFGLSDHERQIDPLL